MNDLPNVCQHLSLILFADDTNAFCHNKNIETLYKNVNEEMEKVINWFKVNKLSLNVGKTNYMLFTKSRKLKKNDLPKLYIDNQEIQEAEFAKFLGVYLDKDLTWEKHIEIVTSKVARNIGIMRRLKSYLPPNILKTLYCTLILPQITYCNTIWTNTYKIRLARLKSLQKQAIKLFAQTGEAQNVYKTENLLKLEDIGNLQLYTIIKDFFKGNLPNSLSSLFNLNTEIHAYNTRSRHNFHTEYNRMEISKQKPSFQATKLWNNTDTNTRTRIISQNSYKHIIKQMFINKY